MVDGEDRTVCSLQKLPLASLEQGKQSGLRRGQIIGGLVASNDIPASIHRAGVRDPASLPGGP